MYDLTVFKDFRESELLIIRGNAINSILNNSLDVISATNTRDLSISIASAYSMTPQQIVHCCDWALQRINPTLYGSNLIRRKRIFVV